VAEPSERQPRTAQTEARIERIAELMRRFRFVRGKTTRALAKEWGLELCTVRGYTAEASKRVRAELEDPDFVRADVSLTLATIMRRARVWSRRRTVKRQHGCSQYEPPDWQAAKVAIDAARTWAAITGNVEKSRVDVTHHAGDFTSAKDALAYIRELLPELEAEAANEKGAA
jgi:hypothetical protein